MSTKTFDIQAIKTTISIHAGAHIVGDKLASRATDLVGFGAVGYQLVSTVKFEDPVSTTTYDIQVIKTTISTHAGANIVSDKLAARAFDIKGMGLNGYQLVSTVKLEGEGFVTLVDTFKQQA